MYSVNWYGRNRTDMRKDLALMIFRAQRTKILNVGKMSDLNYTLLIAVSNIYIGTSFIFMFMSIFIILDFKKFYICGYINLATG